jgi:hypothetical protein
MLVFSTPSCELFVLPLYHLCALSALYLLSDLPHPSPLPKVNVQYVQTYRARTLVLLIRRKQGVLYQIRRPLGLAFVI